MASQRAKFAVGLGDQTQKVLTLPIRTRLRWVARRHMRPPMGIGRNTPTDIIRPAASILIRVKSCIFTLNAAVGGYLHRCLTIYG